MTFFPIAGRTTGYINAVRDQESVRDQNYDKSGHLIQDAGLTAEFITVNDLQ
ncbi:MAG: hypothetical protein WBA57_02395 [Elainellaceae cyanobacterium]